MRVAERHEAHGLRCPLGELLDLSITGLRCRCDAKPNLQRGAIIPLVIQNGNQTIRLMARVVWVRKAGLVNSQWQAGLQFLDVRPGIQAALEQFARYGFIQSTTGAFTSTTTSAATATTPAPAPSAEPPRAQQQSTPPPASTPDNTHKYATVDIEDLYAHMGLCIGATEASIHAAYRAIAKQLHPDHNKDPAAVEQFVFINKAYGVLRDAGKRAKYDAMLRASQAGRKAQAGDQSSRASPQARSAPAA
jgi:hypothetical protein